VRRDGDRLTRDVDSVRCDVESAPRDEGAGRHNEPLAPKSRVSAHHTGDVMARGRRGYRSFPVCGSKQTSPCSLAMAAANSDASSAWL